MTANEFRRLALDLPEAIEASHMGHPDFRVGGKIFATLGPRGTGWGMVKLTPLQQKLFVEERPKIFEPVKGGWGLRGATYVQLRMATSGAARKALAAAWCNTAPKRLVKEFKFDLG